MDEHPKPIVDKPVGALAHVDKVRWKRGLVVKKLTPMLLREIFHVAPWHVAGLAIAVLIRGLLPGLFVIFSGLLVASLPAAVAHGLGTPEANRMLLFLIVLACLHILQQASAPAVELLVRLAGNRLDVNIATRAMAAVLLPPGIRHLEDPAMSDRVHRAQALGTDWIAPSVTIESIPVIAIMRLSALVSTVLLMRFVWWAPLLVLPSILVRSRLYRRHTSLEMSFWEARAPAFKQATYLRDLALLPHAAKEIRVFGLPEWLVGAFTKQWFDSMGDIWRGRRQHTMLAVLAGAQIFVSYGAVLLMIALAAAQRQIGVAEVVIYAQAAIGMEGFTFSWANYVVERGGRIVRDALALEQLTRSPSFQLSGHRDSHDLPQAGIRFENVHFRYPGREDYVFKGLDLWIPARSSLALVGENGAGKTTLVKLLCRLYEPEAGRVTVDGIDLRELDPVRWQRRVGAIFQDFVRYELPASSNVGFGAPEVRDKEALWRAARKAGADGIIASLPQEWDTILTRQHEDGVDLSGGQWQRIALARALHAVEGGAGILVLDEPTAQLDVRAEAALYDDFLDLTAGLTTILISHRFSTVRRADRICVIEHGRLVEDGSHHQLVARGGRYAEMFSLQASRFIREEIAANA
jgi:ABC-type multidrug transport system fused ATPase/permease subunit